MPCVEILSMIQEGFQFLSGNVTNLQLRNLMMISTSLIIHGKFNLSLISRSFLKEKTVNAFSHCLQKAKFNLLEAMRSYHNMLLNSNDLKGGRFIIDDTMEHHSRLCKFIYGVGKHFDHVFKTNVSAKCLVFLYYGEDGWIKFPIGWRIYFRNGKKTKHELAIDLIKEALDRGFPSSTVLADSWFCIEPFVKELQKLNLKYILDIKTNATIQKEIPETAQKKMGRKRKKWYTTLNIVQYMEKIKEKRIIGFCGDLESGKPEQTLYSIKEKVCIINALPGKHKIILSHDPKRNSTKYLITNELTWEGVKIVKEYFQRWIIEEFFRNAKQQLNMEGACVRSEQGVTITLFLVSCIDSLIHRKIAKLVSENSQSGPITAQSVIRLAFIENAENFVKIIKSSKGKIFLDKWITQLKNDAIRERKVNSEVIYLDNKIPKQIKTKKVA